MCRMEKWKRVLFIIISILVAIRILYIGVRGEINKEYYTSMSYDMGTAKEIPCQNISEIFTCDKARLDSLELILNNIADDKAGTITLGIWKGETLIYQTGISLGSVNNQEWKKVFVNAEIQQNTEYIIKLNANEDCTQIPTVFTVNDAASEIKASYSGGKETAGRVVINFGYLRFPGVFDRLSVISLWILFTVAVFCILSYFDKIKAFITKGCRHITTAVRPSALITALEILACIIIIDSSGIEFQPPTRVILYAISLFSVVKFEDKRAYIKKLADRQIKRIFIYFLYLYSAFALTGQRILIYPLDLKLAAAGIFVFAVTVLWFVPVVNTLLYYMEAAWKHGMYIVSAA